MPEDTLQPETGAAVVKLLDMLLEVSAQNTGRTESVIETLGIMMRGQEVQMESALKLLMDIKKGDEEATKSLTDAINSLNDSKYKEDMKNLVEQLKGLGDTVTKSDQTIQQAFTEMNKTLLEILQEAKKKDEFEYEVEITPEIKAKLQGEPGKTPVKGEDYFTDAEYFAFVSQVTSKVIEKVQERIQKTVPAEQIPGGISVFMNKIVNRKIKVSDLEPGILPPDLKQEVSELQEIVARLARRAATITRLEQITNLKLPESPTASTQYAIEYNPETFEWYFVEVTGGGGVTSHHDLTNLTDGDDHTQYQLRTEKNQANGYVGLGSDSKINSAYLPAIAITNTFVVGSQAAMLALTAETGDIAVRTDITKTFILQGSDPTILANWTELLFPTDAVSSVFGRTGPVTAATGDYDADQIDETATRVFVTPAEKAKLATVGEEVTLQVYATENILKGQVVGLGAVISGTKQSAYLVDANTRAGGIATEDIGIGTEGQVMVRGLLTGIDTSAFTGSAWVSETTLGALQNSAPVIAGTRSQPVGEYIESDPVNGVMYVNIQAPERIASEIYAQTTTGDTSVQGAITEIESNLQGALDILRPSDIGSYDPHNFDNINPNTSSNDLYGMILGIDNAFGKTRGKMRVPVGQHVSASQNGTVTTTLAPGANNFKLMPFVPYFDFECDQLVANVSTLFAGSNFKFVIYEMVNFRNGSQETGDITDAILIYESGNISGATTGLKTQAVSIQFYAGVTYLIGIRTSAGTLAFTSIAVGALANMQGHGATPATNMFTNHQKTLAFATGADTNPTSFVGINSAFPLIMMRVGSHL